MLALDSHALLLSSMQDVFAQTIVAWIEAKTLAERWPTHADVHALADRIERLMRQVKDLEAVLRDEGVPR